MAKDIFHDIVRMALEKDGWTITHDPYPLRIMGFDLDVDLGAERILAAEREAEGITEKVAVEVKSFLSASFMRDFHNAVGQYTNYKILMNVQDNKRSLYLAIPKQVFDRRFGQPGIRFICEQAELSILVFDEEKKTIVQWEK